MLNVIQNMYKNIKSNINISKSDYFPCNNGVRQGENMSPFLFAVFLNDLEIFLQTKNCKGLFTVTEEIEHELDVFLNIILLLYADDTVLMAETPQDLQIQLVFLMNTVTTGN